MNLKNKNIGFCLTGSFCTLKNSILQMKELVKVGANIIPIMSYNTYMKNKKIMKTGEYIKEIEEITNKLIIHTIKEAEQIGSKNMTDIMIISPCTGNTLAKFSNGIADNVVLIAVKSHLKNENPLVIALSTIDGLSGNAENIGKLLNRTNCFFVPFKQENPITKPRSIVFDSKYIKKTLEYALEREQIQPILLSI